MTEQTADVLPLRPADEKAGLGAKAQYAPARTRAREDVERRSLTLRMPSISMAWLTGLLSGGSLLATAAPAILAIWASHVVAANYFRHWYGRYPRLAYGAFNAFIEAPVAYLWVWSGHSPVLRLVILAALLIMIHLTGHHIVWRYL